MSPTVGICPACHRGSLEKRAMDGPIEIWHDDSAATRIVNEPFECARCSRCRRVFRRELGDHSPWEQVAEPFTT